jgi:hypothetical protein
MDYALVKEGDALAKANCMEFSRSGGTKDVVTYSSTLIMLAWDRARRILLEDGVSEVRDEVRFP